MDCCENIIKFFMFLINFIFVIVGAGLIGLGAYIQINAKSYLDFLSDNYLNTPIFIMIVGGVIFLVAFFGCCGAWQESACMIYTYAVLLAVILIAQIGAGITAFVLKGDLKGVIQKKMVDGMKNYNQTGHEGVTNAWDILQHDLQCCGSSNYTEWSNYMTNKVPDSCCKGKEEKDCGLGPDTDKINTEGCFKIFEDKFVGNIGIVGGVAVGLAFVQMLGVAFACCLGRGIRKEGMYV